MDINSFIYEEDFENFCRESYEKVCVVCSVLGIVNDEDYYSFKERCYERLEADYMNSIGKTIH